MKRLIAAPSLITIALLGISIPAAAARRSINSWLLLAFGNGSYGQSFVQTGAIEP